MDNALTEGEAEPAPKARSPEPGLRLPVRMIVSLAWLLRVQRGSQRPRRAGEVLRVVSPVQTPYLFTVENACDINREISDLSFIAEWIHDERGYDILCWMPPKDLKFAL